MIKRHNIKHVKLLIVHHSLRGGGIERVISLISQYVPSNCEVCLALNQKQIRYKLKPGTKVYLIHPYRSPRDFLRSLCELYAVVLKERPSAVMGMKGKVWNLISLLIGIKRIISVRGYPTYTHVGVVNKFLYQLKKKLIYQRASKIIAVSQKIKEFLVREWRVDPRRVVVIYNPCDVQLIHNLAVEPLNDKEEEIFKQKVLLNVGRLEKQKGQWHLVRAFARVSRELSDVKLVILGEGSLRNYLEKLISELKLRDKVYLLGWKKNPFKYMARSFLFCFPSLWEGFGNVIVEALVCNLPVMSADCLSGPREILAPGTEYKVEKLKEPEYGEYGILMPVMDGRFYSASDPLTWQEEVWAEEIIRCLTNPKRLSEYRDKASLRARDFDARKKAKIYFETIL